MTLKQNDTKQKGTMLNDSQQNEYRQNDTRNNDTQHNNTKQDETRVHIKFTLAISVRIYADLICVTLFCVVRPYVAASLTVLMDFGITRLVECKNDILTKH
jgi:hypothetical protein